jgi:tetratricopeptide (TPR) repeat protein
LDGVEQGKETLASGNVESARNPGVSGPIESGSLPMLSAGPILWLSASGDAQMSDTDRARRAYQEAAAGDALIRQGQFQAALQRYREAIRLQPLDPAYHGKLAAAADRLNQSELVERHLLEALRLEPNYAAAHNALGQWYFKSSRVDSALRHGAAAVALDPKNSDFVIYYGLTLLAAGEAQAAWELIKPLVAAGVTSRWLALLYARLAPRFGQEAEALALAERALLVPGLSAYPDGKPLIHYAAASLLDRMGRYDEAFQHARLANELIRSVSRPYDPDAGARWVSQKVEYLSRDRFQSLPRATHGNRRPVFIVGMPRSGTTLVEQILASHPAVFGGGEMLTLGRIARTILNANWAEGRPYPESLDVLSPRVAGQLASDYLSAMEAMNTDATYVTDKMPLNCLNLELVELLLPGCRVIHCVRSPMDTCLSCYMTSFAGGNDFKFDLSHLGAFHRDYRRLMDHWKKVLTLPMLEVRYEDVVLDMESQARRMLEFLDLPWDEQCLKFHENKRPARSASEDQVRRPIYTSSIGRWKNYEKHLAELIAALGR